MQITTLMAEVVAGPLAFDPVKYKKRTRPGICAFLMAFSRAVDARLRYRQIVNELSGMSECQLADLGLDRRHIAAAAVHLAMKQEHESVSEWRIVLQNWSEAQGR